MQKNQNLLFNKKKALLQKLSYVDTNQPYLFYSYQEKFFLDQNRFKIWLKSRQVGGTWLLSLEALLQAFLFRNPIVVLTANSNLLDEFRDQFHLHFLALVKLYPTLKPTKGGENRSVFKIPFLLDNGDLSSQSIRCSFLLSNPRTARGFKGTVILDEFAFHQDPEAIFYATLPMITRSHSYSFLIASTPCSYQDFFHRLYMKSKEKGSLFSSHFTSIYQALDQGLDISIEPIRQNMDDIQFRRAYLCEFLNPKDALFTEDLLDASSIPLDPNPVGEVFIGIDLARRHHLSAISLIDVSDSNVFLRKIFTFKDTSFESQVDFIFHLMEKYQVKKCAIDSTGMGLPISESLEKAFHSRIIPITFSAKMKQNLLFQIRWALFNKRLFLLQDPLLKAEFLALNFQHDKLDGSISDQNSHCDRFWSLALAYHAFLFSPHTNKSLFVSENKNPKKFHSWKNNLFY